MQATDAVVRTVTEGSTVEVFSGTIELRLQSGTNLVMQGPAMVNSQKLQRPVVQEGWLRIDSGASDGDFAVEVAGVGNQGTYGGFEETNRSVYLSGDPEKSTIFGLSGPRGVLRREGAVSFWIRSLPGGPAEQVLWLAGQSQSGLREPEESFLHTRLTRKGRLCFSVKNEGDDVELISARSLSNGAWHHVVASWGPASVDLFVDGKLVARDQEARQFKEGVLTGRYVRFGKPGSDLRRRGFEPFRGWVDEIAMWNRPLTHEEVLHYYESARRP